VPFDADPLTPGNASFKGENESLWSPFSTTCALILLQEELDVMVSKGYLQ
jgi:hypothetical protein